MRLIPSANWRMLDERLTAKAMPKGLDALWDTGLGLAQRGVPRQRMLLKRAEQVLALADGYAAMKGEQLKEEAAQLRRAFRCRRETAEELIKAFALVREVAYRQLGEKPYLVQVAGALALEKGFILEMATGEGKTLTASLAGTIAGWRGQGCHIITVNDYLAQRDAAWMKKVYNFCGVSVAHVIQDTTPEERRKAYQADVTYLTNKEVAADFLRDRLALDGTRGLSAALLSGIGAGRGYKPPAGRVIQRGLFFAIVDEADSILIDEAVTPLIISGRSMNQAQIDAFMQAAQVASQLDPETDYRVDQKYREVKLSELGDERVLLLAADYGGIWRGSRRCRELVKQALTARELFKRDQHYVIQSGKVVIVDEFTGRLMPDRTWREGLHQAIEAKENLAINPPKDTLARISFQRFFRMYRRLSGMTGTATEAVAEFWQIYHLPVVVLPTHRPCRRERQPTIVMPTEFEKWKRLVTEIQAVHETGRPVLVGTRSVQASERLSRLLDEAGLFHRVLNAVKHKEEALIVAKAGQKGRITVATNMAGRGTDIKLGEGVAELGGLHVIAAEPNESARIDRQLFGRGARQGDPGSAQAIFSLEDEIITRYTGKMAGYLRKRKLKAQREVSSLLVRGLVRNAQNKAEKLALKRRKSVLRTDHWLDEQLGFAGAE